MYVKILYFKFYNKFILTADKVFHEMYPDDDTDDDSDSIHQIPLQYTSKRRPLVVKVQPSETFYDTPQFNLYLEYYSTRSKKRGRLLIINNFDFISQKHSYRNGADVDNANIVALFKQMGGWDIQVKNNITAAVSINKLIIIFLIQFFAFEKI